MGNRPKIDASHGDVIVQIRIMRVIKSLQNRLYGEVLLAIDDNGQQVVVKISKLDHIDYRYTRENPVKEVQVLRYLQTDENAQEIKSHPNIIRLIDSNDLEPMSQITVLEYLDGGDLLEYLNNYTSNSSNSSDSRSKLNLLPLDKVNYVIGQIVDGLFYLHGLGVAHYDFSLENILVSNDLTLVKICDFGQSQILDDPQKKLMVGSDQILPGKTNYLAPEAIDDYFYPQDLDMFALGVCIFMILTSITPFETAQTSNKRYRYFLHGRKGLDKMLDKYRLSEAVPDKYRDLIMNLICPARHRLKIGEVKNIVDQW